MIRFTSTRERKLWGCALAILTAIMISAVFAGSLVGVLRSEGLLGFVFAAGFILAITAVVGMALRAPRHRAPFWAGLGVVAVLMMIPVRGGLSPVERTHLFEYGLLASVLYEALLERRHHTRVPRPGLAAIVTTSLLGWLDEALQALVPSRVYDTRDVAVNALAALVAVSSVAAIRWGDNWRRSRQDPPLGS